jgi:uncharacterized membrane protein YphA (DoxX/SURF4 family)
MNPKKLLLWICRILVAVILLQTLYFKFSAAPESVYIFSKVGMEPYGRIATGIAELIASILILIPKTSLYGALIALGVMIGAIATHLFVLGIVVMDDGGQLFINAVLVTLASLVVIYHSVKARRTV